MGVGWETIRELNPRAVLVSSQLLGSRGAVGDWIGYGPSTQPIGGLVHLWNYDDQEAPAGSASIFPDHLAGRLARDRTRWRRCCAASAPAAAATARWRRSRSVTGMLGDLLCKAGHRARLGEAARQPQRARRALGRVSVRGRRSSGA